LYGPENENPDEDTEIKSKRQVHSAVIESKVKAKTNNWVNKYRPSPQKTFNFPALTHHHPVFSKKKIHTTHKKIGKHVKCARQIKEKFVTKIRNSRDLWSQNIAIAFVSIILFIFTNCLSFLFKLKEIGRVFS
jgi:hypothetical protein